MDELRKFLLEDKESKELFSYLWTSNPRATRRFLKESGFELIGLPDTRTITKM